jgi:predicted transglutaminase-like cysteine proteinase
MPFLCGVRFGLAAALGGAALSAFFVAGASAGGVGMQTGGVTSQPIGHYEFCKTHPAECRVQTRGVRPERLTKDLLRTVKTVNVQVNHAVKPMDDLTNYGREEVWSYPDDGAGDCEDYALEKQRQLHSEGISLSNLLLTVVRKPDGEGHAVLTVQTDKGDFVLDNLTDAVHLWDETGYLYIKRQSSYNSGRWVAIREGQTAVVASVK